MDLRKNPIGLYEKALPNRLNWDEKCACAKAAGFDFIELSVDESDERLSRLELNEAFIQEVLTASAKHQIPIRSMCLSAHRRFPFGSADTTKRAQAYTIMSQAFKLAEALHIKNIQLAGYDVYYESSTEHSKTQFLAGLKTVSKEAESRNIMLSLEVMDTPFMGTIERAMTYVNQVNSPYLKVYPDLGNLTQFSEAPSQELIDYQAHIVAIHLKDTKPNVFKKVPFGKGTVDFKTLFQTLTSMNYQGPWLIEMWADNDLNESNDDCVARIKQAKAWLYERMI